jgi:hypothetical protein
VGRVQISGPQEEVRGMWEVNFSSNAEWVVGVLLAVSVIVTMFA